MCFILYKAPSLTITKKRKINSNPNDESILNVCLERIHDLEVNEDYASIIDEIFNLIQEGFSTQKIGEILDKIIQVSEQLEYDKIEKLMHIIECIFDTNDEECFEYISNDLLTFLFNMICGHNQYLICSGLKCLRMLIEPGKSKCAGSLNGKFILSKSMNLISTYNDNENIASLCLDLFCNLIINYDFSSEVYRNIENMVYQYIDSCNMVLCKQSTVRLIALITHYSPNKIKFFENYENTKRLYNLLTINENLATQVFSAIDSLAKVSETFAMKIIIDTDFLLFTPPNNWNISSLSKFCRPLITLFSVVGKCNQLRKEGEILDLCISKIIQSLKDLIPLLLYFVEEMQFKVKKKSIIVICQLILICNKEIIFYIMTGHIELIDFFIAMLEMKDSFLISIVLKALRTLIYLGDSIVEEMNYKNIFLEKALENNIKKQILNISENYNNDENVTKQLNSLNEVINMCLERAEIDKMDEEEYELILEI